MDEPSQLQHIRQTQPGSPFSAAKTVRFLPARGRQSSNPDRQKADLVVLPTYTALLSRVQSDPTNVRKATFRRRIFADVLAMFLKE